MIHRIYIVFHPEGDEKFTTSESVSFECKKNALEFMERQKQRASVHSASYAPINEEEEKPYASEPI